MPDSYTHKYNAQKALELSKYEPRVYQAFIIGCNGPDPLFFHKAYKIFGRKNISHLAKKIHNEKTSQFIENLFRCASTNAQKDYCLGFLCHYALDTTMHPYINYITTAYGSKFNIEYGHHFFESALDSHISYHINGSWTAPVEEYYPEIKKEYLEQIVVLFKETVEKTFDDVNFECSEYLQCFDDFKKTKKLLCAKRVTKKLVLKMVDFLFFGAKGYIESHIQPCKMPIVDVDVWRNNSLGFFCTSTIAEILERANYMSAEYIDVGIKYFSGIYTVQELMEDVGNKNYETGLPV